MIEEAQLWYLDGTTLKPIDPSWTIDVEINSLDDIGDVSVASPNDNDVLTYNSGTGMWEASSGASGDVSGPASSTDNAIVRFDGTGGKTIQNSGITIDDSDNMSGGNIEAMTLSEIGSPTYSTVQDLMNLGLSAGHVSGGAITDAGSGNIDVAAGTGFIRTADDDVSEVSFFDWSASNGNSIPSGATRFVGVEYNGGSPQVTIRSTQNWNYDTDFPLGRVVNEGGTLYIMDDPWQTGDATGNIIERLDSTGYIVRDERGGGLIVSNTGTRNVAVTAGTLLSRLAEYSVSAIDTSGSDNFDAYFRDGSGGWTKQADQTQWENDSYDDGSGTLQSAGALSPFIVRWWYITTNGELLMLYGQDDHSTFASATEEAPPNSVPERINELGILIGRFIINDGESTPRQVDSAFQSTFTPVGVTDHGNLAGLGDDDHTQYLLVDGTRAMTGELDMGSDKIINVVDPTAAQDAVTKAYSDSGTQTFTNKTIDADNNTISNLAVGSEVDDDIAYNTAQNTTSNLGNLGATETVDFNTNTSFRGTLDSNVTITVSNVSSGQRGSLILYYDGTAQRTITWSGVDVWIGGSEPDAPSVTNEPLVVTVWNDGNLTIASGGIAS